MYHLVHLEWMARSYVEAEAVARPAPDVVWELAGDAKQLLRVGAVEREGAHGRGAQAAGGAARTHAAERGANARGRALRERTRPSAARTHAAERCANARDRALRERCGLYLCAVHQV